MGKITVEVKINTFGTMTHPNLYRSKYIAKLNNLFWLSTFQKIYFHQKIILLFNALHVYANSLGI